MESQLPRSHEPYDTAGLQTVAEGHGDEQHHEKKSVLGKVKAKAKKIKNTLTKHSHGHDHDHDHDDHEQYCHDEEEDYDEDEKMVEDPEVHGAPIYDSASVTVPAPPTGTGSNSMCNLEKPSVKEEDRYESSIILEPPVRCFAQSEEENSGQTRGNLGSSASKPEDKHVSSGVNAQNVNDPIGNGRGQGEIFTDPVGNENFSGPFEGRGGNLPESMGNVGGRGRKSTDSSGNVQGPGENFGVGIGGGSMGMEEDPQTNVADPTGTGEEIGDTPILPSLVDKMGIYNEPQHKPKPEAKQKLYTVSHNQFSPETNTPTTSPHETSPLDHSLSENPSSNQSSYTQMISSAAFSVANKAVSAKNAVANTIGYGGTETERPSRDSAKRPNEMHEEVEATKPVGGAATEYTRKITSTVTDTLAPVYGKVAGTGSTVMSKVVQGGPDKGLSVKEYWVDKLRPGDEDKALSEVISGAFTNKGKEGGAEEREGEDSRGVCEEVSDAVHKRAPEENEREEDTRMSMGKVTESKAVAEGLGTGGEVGGGGGVVDTVRGTVSSWLGKGSESQTSQGTTDVGNEGTTGGEAGHGHGQDDVGETRPRDLNN